MSTKVGLIAFCNDGGLGAQTRRLYEMIHPDKVLVIDSRRFSKNKEHHEDWYPGAMVTQGFPKNYEVLEFIEGLTHVFTVENPYNFYLVHACYERGIKVICQTNYEFCENLDSPHLPVPSLFLMPSYWKLEEMEKRFGEKRVQYLPPPISVEEFEQAREFNQAIWGDGKNHLTRFLHVVGTLSWKDRNGTIDLLDAVKLCKEDFELTIKSQHPLPPQYNCLDPRVYFEISNIKRNEDLYFGYDAMILPRRYAGLSLTMNEALMSALPVMMTDISPNNKILPASWLVPAEKKGEFLSREVIEYYSADHQSLADRIDSWATADLKGQKHQAFEIGWSNFSTDVLRKDYDQILGR